MRKEDSVEVNYSGVQEVMSKYKEILKKSSSFFLNHHTLRFTIKRVWSKNKLAPGKRNHRCI